MNLCVSIPFCRYFSVVLFAAIFSLPAHATDTQDWLQLRQQTIVYLSDYRSAEKDQKAETSAKALVKAAEELGPLPRNLRPLIESLSFLANALEIQNRYADVLATRLRSLQLQERYYGKESAEICVTLTRLASTYTTLGKSNDAEAAYKRVLAIKERSDPNHLTGILMNLGQHYDSEKKYGEAEVLFKRLVVLYEKDGGNNNPKLKPVLGYLSMISHNTGREKEARTFAARAAAIQD